VIKKLIKLVACAVLLAGALQASNPPDRKIVYRQDPDYPAIAAQMNLHGTVKLKIWINSEGDVRRLEYIGGHPLLAQSALKAVKDWKYEPGPKETTAQVEVKF
jgi:TonB family protein